MPEIVIWILGYLVFGIVFVVLYLVITRAARRFLGPRRRLEEEIGMTLLRARLKRGEISRDEFNQAASALLETEVPRRQSR